MNTKAHVFGPPSTPHVVDNVWSVFGGLGGGMAGGGRHGDVHNLRTEIEINVGTTRI